MNTLTRKERQIAILVAQGMTNKEIAQRLGSSPFTVRNQVKVIIRKLELKNRIQVAYLIGRHQNGRSEVTPVLSPALTR
jgi:DNA-binding NarL/FixJ family response regulator